MAVKQLLIDFTSQKHRAVQQHLEGWRKWAHFVWCDGTQEIEGDAALQLHIGTQYDALQQAAQQVAQALDILARLGNAPQLGNSNGNLIAQEALAVLEKVGVKHG